jgi:nitrogen fixation/metabolism regulation signal transduction histidine kinase
MEQRLTVSASELTIANKIERLISLMNIQSELDGAQLSAWQDLVRVLTHEIMNSITPVASLAKTAVDLVDDARTRVKDPEVIEELADARDAVDTVARRSDGLMAFVSSYRQLTRPPAPEKSRFALRDLFSDVERIVAQELPETIELQCKVEPQELDIQADRQLLEQILINLLQNSHHALEGRDAGTITLASRLNKRGHVIVEVLDDGPGVPEENVSRIFVPFYTTRREGSGVGLALSRQIMIAHGGTISFSNRPEGGAAFTLVF